MLGGLVTPAWCASYLEPMYLTVDYRSYGRDLCVCSKSTTWMQRHESYEYPVLGITGGACFEVRTGGCRMFPTRLPTSRPWLIQGEGWTLLMFRAVSMMSGV